MRLLPCKASFNSVYITCILLWITFPEILDAAGICFGKYIPRTGRCKKKIREDGGRVLEMDFNQCCRKKNAKAWQLRVGGIKQCFKCPNIVDGGWSKWTSWNKCPVTCDWGNHTRSRKCDNPSPQHGGRECKGKPVENRVCYAGKRCPIDGGWGPWAKWQACSKTCNAGGVQFRSRRCDSPRPQFGGRHCRGTFEESRKCNENVECPVHGNWGSWSSWSACSSECNSVRRRLCDNPAPNHGGKLCEGQTLQRSSCPPSCRKKTVPTGGSGSGSGTVEGSGSGSEVGSGSSGEGDKEVDVKVEVGPGVVPVKPTKSTKKIPEPSGSGEGSGDGDAGPGDTESGDVTPEVGGSGQETKNKTKTKVKGRKENKTKIDNRGSGSGELGSGVVDVNVENSTKKGKRGKSGAKKAPGWTDKFEEL